MLTPPPHQLVDDTSSLAHRCRLGEEESIPLLPDKLDDAREGPLLGRSEKIATVRFQPDEQQAD